MIICPHSHIAASWLAVLVDGRGRAVKRFLAWICGHEGGPSVCHSLLMAGWQLADVSFTARLLSS